MLGAIINIGISIERKFYIYNVRLYNIMYMWKKKKNILFALLEISYDLFKGRTLWHQLKRLNAQALDSYMIFVNLTWKKKEKWMVKDWLEQICFSNLSDYIEIPFSKRLEMTGICICIMIKKVDHYLSYIHFIRDFCNDQDKIEILLYNKLNNIYRYI